MAKFIIRDSEGNVEKIVDKKMHRDRKYQGGGGYGCLCLLVVVVGLIIYFSLIKDKNKNTGDEETTNAEYVHLGKKKTVTSRHLKKAAGVVEEDSIPADTAIIVQEVVSDVVDNVVENVVGNVVEDIRTSEPQESPDPPVVVE